MKASDAYVPPMCIFPRENPRENPIAGSPPESSGAESDSGYTNDDLFVMWQEHFAMLVNF